MILYKIFLTGALVFVCAGLIVPASWERVWRSLYGASAACLVSLLLVAIWSVP